MEIELYYWNHEYNGILLLSLGLLIALLLSLRLFSGVVSHVNASDELFKKNNPAFGISMAGMVFAVAIMLSGTIFGDPVRSYEGTIVSVGVYGVIGLILFGIARIIFDKVALPKVSIESEILRGNIAVSIIDAGNVIGTALVIRAVMVWVESNTIEGLVALLVAFVVSQVILTLATYVRTLVFSRINKGKSMQDALHDGNIALALNFAGRRIGTAFAITAASNIMLYELVYEMRDIHLLILAWACISVLVILALSALSFVADSIILFGVNKRDEVINQRNIAVGALEGVIYVSLGYLVSELFNLMSLFAL